MLQEFLTNFQTGWRVMIIFSLSNLGNTQEISAVPIREPIARELIPSNTSHESFSTEERRPLRSLENQEVRTQAATRIPKNFQRILDSAPQTAFGALKTAELTYRIAQLKGSIPRLAGENDTNYHQRIYAIAKPQVEEHFTRNSDQILNQIHAAGTNNNLFTAPRPGETPTQFRSRIQQAANDLVTRIMRHRRNFGNDLDTGRYYSRAQSW